MNEPAFIEAIQHAAGAVVSGVDETPDRLGSVAPADVASLAAVLRLCTERQQPVWPLGAGTWQPAALPPAPRPPLYVSTAGLNGILEHEPADLVIGVQAGMSLNALHEHLAGSDQRLPLDPPAVDGATIGATIALGCGGPLRAGHGLPRDMALGVEVVTGDGRVLRYGGRVVKNVAGYDGVRLFTGSAGALGIITAIFLRVRGMPRADRSWSVAAPDVGRAAQLALALRSAIEPDALELLSPALASDVGLDPTWMVLVRSSGSEEAVTAADARVAEVAACAGLSPDTADCTLWPRLAALEGQAFPHVILPVGVAEAVTTLEEIGRNFASRNDIDHHWRAAAHVTDGTVRSWLNRADSAGGAVATPAAPAVSPAPKAAAAAIARRLSAAFDPAGVLLPGRPLREAI